MLPASVFTMGAQKGHGESFPELPKNIVQHALQIFIRPVEPAVFGKKGCSHEKGEVCVCARSFHILMIHIILLAVPEDERMGDKELVKVSIRQVSSPPPLCLLVRDFSYHIQKKVSGAGVCPVS